MKLLLTSIFCLFLSSCFLLTTEPYELPTSYNKNAPPEWKLGWQHGCESGYSAYGNNWYKTMYKFKQDVSMIKNEFYFKGWNDGFNFCRSYINRRLSGNNLEFEETPTLFSTTNLNVTNAGRRDDSPILKTGFLGGQDNKGFFGDAFTVYTPGYGSMSWGANASRCDWLNRCGDDQPNDPIGSWWGNW